MIRVFEKGIINRYGALTPSRILAYFTDKNSFFQEVHEKRPYTFIILGRSGPTGKSWLYSKLKEHGFNTFELSESVISLVDYRDERNHVLVNGIDNSVIIVLNQRYREEEV